MRFLHKREFVLMLTVVGLAVANILIYLFLVHPVQNRAAVEEEEYRIERERLAYVRGKVALAKTIKESRIAIADLTERLPAKDDLPTLITEIHALAEENGLRIPSVKYEPKQEKGERLLKLTISLPVVGDYPDIRAFIADLERSRRLVMIEKIGISSSFSESGETNLQMKLITYIRPLSLKTPVSPVKIEG